MPRPQRLVAGGTSLASRVHRPPVVSARGKDDANRRPQRRGRVGMGSHKGDSESRLEFLSALAMGNLDYRSRRCDVGIPDSSAAPGGEIG